MASFNVDETPLNLVAQVELENIDGTWRHYHGVDVNDGVGIGEVMVNGDQFAVIRARPSFDDMINRDTIPTWA